MADYISREAALEAIKRQFLDTADARDIPLSSALVDVDAIPSADVVPVRHGRWEWATDTFWLIPVCSICKRKVYMAVQYDLKANEHAYPFCPYCGGRIDIVVEPTVDNIHMDGDIDGK